MSFFACQVCKFVKELESGVVNVNLVCKFGDGCNNGYDGTAGGHEGSK